MGRYAPSTKILSLDLATKLGWACGKADGVPVSGRFKLPVTGNDVGQFLAAYHMWLVQLIHEHKPQLIAFEAPIAAMGQTTMSTDLKLKGLAVHTEFVGCMKKITYVQVGNGTWKKDVCGNGRFGKKEKPYPPMVKMESMGFKPADDNEADALCIWHHIVNSINPMRAAESTPLFARAV